MGWKKHCRLSPCVSPFLHRPREYAEKSRRVDTLQRARRSPPPSKHSKRTSRAALMSITLTQSNRTDAATRHQLTMDLLDLWLPATALNLVNIPDGVVGILGCVASISAFDPLLTNLIQLGSPHPSWLCASNGALWVESRIVVSL